MKPKYNVYSVADRVTLVNFITYDALARWMKDNCTRDRRGNWTLNYNGEQVAIDIIE